MPANQERIHVSLVAVPDAVLSTLSGLYDVLTMFEGLAPNKTPFAVDIVGPTRSVVNTASGLPVAVHCAVDEVERTDIVIVPSLLLEQGEWRTGRYPELVSWLSCMYARGALLCSACSGVLLLAETGLLEGWEATLHWAYARTFQRNFPNVRLRLEKVLVVTGEGKRFVMSGASASWHDLALYLIARHAGPAATQSIAKFFLLQWHTDGQAPYIVFEEDTSHGDAIILAAQAWLSHQVAAANPVERMVQQSGLAERSFKRRFRKATGYPPITYVQHLRVEAAKEQLETTGASVDSISWNVGYEDPAFFRRLFKRVTGLTPGAYRRKFRLPAYALSVVET
ncbi:MAG: GlxA family transcriptional regulator [Acidiferrobacterales bacterium]